jgi:hypothetical protein
VALITTGTVTNLTSTAASVASANVGVALITTGTVTSLTATGASVASANVGTAVVTGLTVTNASVASLNAGTATITTGNLTFSSTAQRITGDFSNATLSSRLYLQTSTTNANTGVGAIPNGTAVVANFRAISASDPTNASYVGMNMVGGSDARFDSGIFGTGTYLPMTFYTGGSERVRIDTSGNVGIGTASPTAKLHVVSGTGAMSNFVGNNSNNYIQVSDDNASNYVSLGAIGGGNAYLYSGSGKYTAIYSGAAERMRIDSSGNVGIGGTAAANAKVHVLGTLPTSSNNSQAFRMTGEIPSGSTTLARSFFSFPSTQAASFTLTDLYHFDSFQGSFGAGSAVTNQYGFHAGSSLTGATNNYGFFSNIASGSNRWNFYAAGTAQNYFAGNTGVGAVSAADTRFQVRGSDATSSNYAIVLQNSTPASLFYVRNDGLMFTGLAANSPYNVTTANAANVEIANDGIMRRSTSSLRYKSDVVNATHGLADVLKLRSVTYKGKNDGDRIFGGLIAEEVHDAGLTEFVAYDKEGRPDAIHYGNMVALLVKAVQELTARVAELEAK